MVGPAAIDGIHDRQRLNDSSIRADAPVPVLLFCPGLWASLKPRTQEGVEILLRDGTFLGSEPDLYSSFTDKAVDLDDTELVDDPHLSCIGLPAVKILVLDKGGDVLFGHRTRQVIEHLLPVRVWGYRVGVWGGQSTFSCAVPKAECTGTSMIDMVA